MGFEVKTYSRKQAGVIYSAMKRGNIEVEQDVISEMYNLVGGVEVYNTNDASYIESFALSIKGAIDSIFSGDFASATKRLAGIAA